MDSNTIIAAYYRPHEPLTRILIDHSRRVADKAVAVARRVPHLHPDTHFIYEAALLHDIGILHTRAPSIHCTGTQPYVCHGIIGRRLLEERGLVAHALVCERHVGTGISITDIQTQNLPLPPRDMQPVTIEEIIICYADKFFSKTNNAREHELDEVVGNLSRYGQDKVDCFLNWHRQFSE